MLVECRGENCLFCRFAQRARLHPQRPALLQPHLGARSQSTIEEDYTAPTKLRENQRQNEDGGEGGNDCGNAALGSKPPVCSEQTHGSIFSFSNKHRTYEGDKTFTFSTLLTLVNALAMRLRKVLANSPISASTETAEEAVVFTPVRTVGILVGASVEYVIAVLAVLQCGFAFLPLEPSWPAKRITRVVADSQPFILVTSQRTFETFKDSVIHAFPSSVLSIDLECLLPINPPMDTNEACCPCFCHIVGARSYCYVLYTSGSTGKSKGVYGTEMGLLHRLQWMQNEYPFLEDDLAIFKTSVAFVDHLTELFGPLLGGSLVVVPPVEELFRNPLGLLLFCQAYKISRLTAVPSLMRAVLPCLSSNPDSHAFMSVKVLVLSGEILSYHLFRSIQAVLPRVVILNLYGCTELSGDCLFFNCGSLTETWGYFSVPIGKPLPGCIIEILPEHSETRDEGELWVGGVLVALGYHNEPFCRGDKFIIVTDPNAGHHNVRFFRTGDFVRRMEDGSLLFLGRKDRIVKVSGNKVSLDEVESTLVRHPLVAQCALSFQKGVSSEDTIIAYVVLDQHKKGDLSEVPETSQDSGTVSSEEVSGLVSSDGIVSSLRNWLTRRLPPAMIPGCFALVKALPHVSSGKVDYEALSTLQVNRSVATSVDLEDEVGSLGNHIRRVFELVLKCKDISMYDNFFSLGGTSVSAAHAAHYLAIDMRLLYTHPSVIELEPVLRVLWKGTDGLLALDSDEGLSDMRALKRLNRGYTLDGGPHSFRNVRSVLNDSSTSRQAVEDDSWPYVQMGDSPKVLLRSNVCTPMKSCLSMHKLFVNLPSVNGTCNVSILWKTQLEACVDASPVLMCSRSSCLVFIGSHAHKFFCMDAYHGNILWESETGGRVESTAAITSDFKHIVLGSYDGYLYFLDSQTGDLKWKFQTKAEVKCQPTVDWRGLIWCGSHDHHLYVLNMVEQRCFWEYDCKASIFGAAAHDSKRFLTYVATTAGTIMAFSTDCSPPRLTWTHACGAPIFGPLAVDTASGYLICTLVNGKVLAFTEYGSAAWEYTTGGPVFAGTTLSAALPTQALVCSRDGWVYSLHLLNGECLWKYCSGEAITSAAYVDECLALVNEESVDGTTYCHYFRLVCACGSSGQVYVLKVYAGSTCIQSSFFREVDVQNTALKMFEFIDEKQVDWSSESVYTNKEGTVRDLEYTNLPACERCELLAALKLPGDIFSSPVMLGGRIFVGCRDDNLYCLMLSGLDLHKKGVSSYNSTKITK